MTGKSKALFLLLIFCRISALSQPSPVVYDTPDSRAWADTMLSHMNYWQKIGQLFMVDAFSNKDSAHIYQIRQLIDSFQIGGLIFFQGGPYRQAQLTNYYQSRSKIPLLIGIDGEWGLNMRLDSTMRFPRQMTLGAGADDKEVYAMGREIARQCRRLGVHVNFAPVVDINNNPLNPIINSRSFGEEKHRVAQLSRAYMEGLQDGHVLACAKHFPGHGDTDSDSHLALPVVNSSVQRLDSVELFPYRQLIQNGLGSVMVAHLFVPAVDSTPGLAGSLSPAMVNGLLKDSLGFGGIVFTDALNMKGVSGYFKSGELELKALLAGNDVLLYSSDIPAAIQYLHLAVQNCEINESRIDSSVRKILQLKYWTGLNKTEFVDTLQLSRDLFTSEAGWLNYRVYDRAPTLLKNRNNILPLHSYYRDCIASLVLNDTLGNPFQTELSAYAHVDVFSLPKNASRDAIDSLIKLLDDYDRVIVSIHNTSINAAKNFGITEPIVEAVKHLSTRKGNVLVVFGNAYVLNKLPAAHHYDALIQAYEDTWLPHFQTAQKIFGGSAFSGALPVSTHDFDAGKGIHKDAWDVIRYSMPEELGITSASFDSISFIIDKAIRDSVFPGCQVLIARDNTIIYNKAFGYHTYAKEQKVKPEDLYDIASVTKIASTALACMLLYDKHKLDPDAKVSKYLPEFRKTDKKDITVARVMAHQAGFKSWIPFWKSTVDSAGPSPLYYRKQYSAAFSIQVADSLFIRTDYQDTLWDIILNTPLENSGDYVYSDLGMFVIQRVVEKLTGKTLGQYVHDNFYKPLGLWNMGYHPLEWSKSSAIVPTEMDTAFRRMLIRGFVHDPAAAMMGGEAGNAGVFANARSLAVIMQMLLNKGTYAGRRYLKYGTVEKFTSQAFAGSLNRRGLFFDRPDVNLGKEGPTANSASLQAFGHSGFTGTCAWADPAEGLVYIFLSNRVYPSAGNNKLARQNIRTRIMQVAYDAFRQDADK